MDNNQTILKDIEEQQKARRFLWKKPLIINPRREETCFDDFFKQIDTKFTKVKEITIIWLKNEYIKGVQFKYLTEANQVVDGYKMQIYDQGNLEQKILQLQDDEYIIEICGRKGLVIDNLAFKTNLGNYCCLGGNGGGEFSFKAPEGFHYCTFSGSCGDCNSSLTTLLADVRCYSIKQIPLKDKIPHNQQISQSILPVLRNIQDFLSIEEFLNLFLLNKQFANFRFDSFLIKKISVRIIYRLDTNQRKYIKAILGKMDLENQVAQELTSLYQYTKNKIANSSCLNKFFYQNYQGQNQFDGWNVSLNGGNGWAICDTFTRLGNKKCFQSSYDWDELEYKKNFSELFSKDQYNDFINDNAVLVVGGFVGQNGFGGKAKMSLEVFDSDSQKIWEKEITLDNIPREFALMRIFYKNNKKQNTNSNKKQNPDNLLKDPEPSYLIFKVAAKDQKYWQGHYGANFTQIFIRLLPFNYEVKDFLPVQE